MIIIIIIIIVIIVNKYNPHRRFESLVRGDSRESQEYYSSSTTETGVDQWSKFEPEI